MKFKQIKRAGVINAVGVTRLLCWLLVAPNGFAEFPERTPSYCSTIAMREDASLHGVAFADGRLGLAVGDRGVILRTEDGGETWRLVESGVECRLDDVVWVSRQDAVAVGGGYDRITGISRGVALFSQDAGATWNRANDIELPRLRELKFRSDDKAVVAIGDWSAASHSREFVTRDGRTWTSSGELDGPVKPVRARAVDDFAKWQRVTDVPVPIRAYCRIGSSEICAVGDHGVIIRSSNGQRSWKTQRGQQRRSAVLVIANQASSVAWPLVGSESLEMRNRVSVLISDPSISKDPSTASSMDLCNQATVMLGAAGADALSSSSENPLSDSIKKWIQIHQPRAIVLDASIGNSVKSTITEVAIQAGVERVIGYSFRGRGGAMLHSSAMLPMNGILASDLWRDALHLVAPNHRIHQSISLRQLYDASANEQRGESVLAGLQIRQGEKLATESNPVSRRQLQIAQVRLRQPQQIMAVITGSKTTDAFSATMNSLLDQTAAEDRFRLVWNVLQELEDVAVSQPSSADFRVAILDIIAERYANTSAGKWAVLRGDSIRKSLEWSRMQKSLPASLSQDTNVVTAVELVPVSPFQSPESHVVQASGTSPIQVPRAQSVRVNRASKNTRAQSQVDLSWEFHPVTLVARAAAKNRGDESGLQTPSDGSADLRRLAGNRHSRAWAKLIQPTGADSVIALPTKTPPRLDGRLDDPCWESRSKIAKRIQVTYDEDFVYVAVRCDKDRVNKDGFVRTKDSPIRDHDLSSVDHLQLMIDVDRDLLTSMQFATTEAGRTHDAIDGHRGWNPTWYIATKRIGTDVHFEFAITRRDLVDLPIVAGESWFVSAQPVAANDRPESVLPEVHHWIRVVFR